jgi:hyperosmotically inducible protein
MKITLKSVLFFAAFFVSASLFAATETTPAKTDDISITKSVKDKLTADKTLGTQAIVVVTQNGIVTLTADLDTDNQASNAISAARSVPGVSDVNTDNLKVKSSHQPFTDTVITGLVKGSFLQSRLFGETDVPLMSIHVETKNGVVYLTGTAESAAQVSKATQLAKAVKDVKKVDAKVEVKK